MEKKIRFQGSEYLLIGDMIEGGAIATIEQYEKGLSSFAFLLRNGSVIQRGKVIGSRDEIEVIGECEAEIKCSLNDLMTNWFA